MDSAGWLGALITSACVILGGVVTALLKRRPERVLEKNVQYDQVQEDLQGLRVEFGHYKRQAAADLAQVKADAAAQIEQIRADAAATKSEAQSSNVQMRLEQGYQRDVTRVLDNEVMDLRQGITDGSYPPLPPRPPWPVMP